MTDELKPCPFCGDKAILLHRYISGIANKKAYWVKCGKCQSKIQERNSTKKAIEFWNNRCPLVEVKGEKE